MLGMRESIRQVLDGELSRTAHHKLRLLAIFLLLLFFPILLFTNFLALPSLAQNVPPIRVRQGIPENDLPAFAADQIIIKFKPNVNEQAKEALMNERGASVARVSLFGEFVRWGLPECANVTVIAEALNRNPLVEYAHPNFFKQAHFVPNDTIYCLQWHMDDSLEWDAGTASCVASAGNPFGGPNGGGIGMEDAWDIATASASVVVAVIDSGVAYETFSDPNRAECYNNSGELRRCRGPRIDEYFQASDLANTNFTILPGSDLVNSDDHPNDDRNHGTHVTGTVAQSTNTLIPRGVAGVAFGVTLMPVKTLDANGTGFDDVIADAIRFATDNGADVINMSLGGPGASQVLENAVAYAFNNGVFVVASTGNSALSGNPTNYPAAYDAYVFAVGATRFDETRSDFSSFGSYVDAVAPGGDTSEDQNSDGFADGVLQQTFGDNSDTSDFAYWFFQGTSMASPHVAALAALILSIDDSLSPTQVRNIIETTAEDKGTPGRDDEYGHGIIDANAALSSISPVVSIVLTTDGDTPFGVVALNATIDTTLSGTNDKQTVLVASGSADLDVKSTDFSDGGNTWSLDTVNGADQVLWEFSEDASTWTTFSAANSLFSLDTNVAQSDSRDLYLRLTMPTSTLSNSQHSATVTIVASSP